MVPSFSHHGFVAGFSSAILAATRSMPSRVERADAAEIDRCRDFKHRGLAAAAQPPGRPSRLPFPQRRPTVGGRLQLVGVDHEAQVPGHRTNRVEAVPGSILVGLRDRAGVGQPRRAEAVPDAAGAPAQHVLLAAQAEVHGRVAGLVSFGELQQELGALGLRLRLHPDPGRLGERGVDVLRQALLEEAAVGRNLEAARGVGRADEGQRRQRGAQGRAAKQAAPSGRGGGGAGGAGHRRALSLQPFTEA